MGRGLRGLTRKKQPKINFIRVFPRSSASNRKRIDFSDNLLVFFILSALAEVDWDMNSG